jgi:hypothetical protein
LKHQKQNRLLLQFLTNLKDNVNKNENFVLRVSLNLPEEVNTSHETLLENRDLLKSFKHTPEREAKFEISTALTWFGEPDP